MFVLFFNCYFLFITTMFKYYSNDYHPELKGEVYYGK
jgi:phosphate starvation-inducible membrane PsiE